MDRHRLPSIQTSILSSCSFVTNLRREGRGGRVGGGKRKRERSKYRESSYLEAMESASRNENENEVYPYAYPGCIFLQRTSDPRMLDLLLSPPRARKADTFAFKFFNVFPHVISFAYECIFVNIAFLFSWKKIGAKRWKKYSWIDAQLFIFSFLKEGWRIL